MTRFDRMTVLSAMIETGLVPVFYNSDIEVAKAVAEACAAGGSRLLEFTNRGDFALEVFAELEKHCRRNLPSLILGVGSIVDAPTAMNYVGCGASFVVGPLLNAEVSRACNRRKIPYLPGCGSVTEISAAEELGTEIVKIFPGTQVGGPGFVKAVLGPCPWTRIMPTGGVSPTEESLKAWFGAGISCAGIGSELITKDVLKARDWNALTQRVRETLSLISRIRKG
jgi:2-dehydro-3-deoxyphosphogluconate aldolase / (4S)-4-hydroxy-2-oxoglutarate aldolase